ncbi:MAG: pyridoxal phosphate-dependent aminotransferase [Planctomycetota bacterium]
MTGRWSTRSGPSRVDYIRWAKENVGVGEYPLTMSAVPPVDWKEVGIDPRSLELFEFSRYGDEELLAGIAGEWGLTSDHVLLGGSASHAHFCCAAALLEPGDRVLQEMPGYLPLLDGLSVLGVETVPFHRRFEDGYRLPVAELRESVRDRQVRLLLLTDLHNPSGVALTEEERRFLADLCEDSGVTVIVDEMYRPFIEPDPGPLHRLHDGIIAIRGLNKVHGLSQIRVGWGIGAPAVIERARRVLDGTTIHNSCLTDQVARQAWRVRDRLVERARRIAAEGNAILGDWLRASPLEVVEPDGGLVWFPRVPPSVAEDGDALRTAALRVGVNLTPGRFFGAPSHVRGGCALPPPALREALRRLAGALPGFAR